VSDPNPFENLTAEDFDRSSARDEREHRNLDFPEWVEQYLETARITYESSEGHCNPWVVLANHEQRRLFTPDDDENNAAFFSRIQREARLLDARLVFVAMISRSAFGRDQIPTAAEVRNQISEFDPIFQDSILWYAELKHARGVGGPDEQARYGMIPVHLGRAGEVIENTDRSHNGANSLFVDILR
jgi:hypothetical protein